MPAARKRRIVVDACIARGASDIGNDASLCGKRCREFLLGVLDKCFRVAMTTQVYDEWKRHESAFAKTWRTSMVARRKLYKGEAGTAQSLRDRVSGTAQNDNQRQQMMKDMHLVEAALMTDNCIASLDESARSLFSVAMAQVSELSSLDWLNPETKFDEVVEWFDDGAPEGRFPLN